MSLREFSSVRNARRSIVFAVLLVAGVAAGCQVRPLYSQPAPGSGLVSDQAKLASIGINPVDTRYGQEVRNHLIFLLSGGAGEPASPAYKVTLAVTTKTSSAAIVQIADPGQRGAGQPTAGTVQVTGAYTITEVATSKQVATGLRTVYASFDRPRQSFAELRAERDAQNRAARELAEQLQLAIAQKMSRL